MSSAWGAALGKVRYTSSVFLRPTRLMVYAVLTLQLSLGMSWPSMRPATAATVSQAREAGARPCPAHEMSMQGAASAHTQSNTQRAAHPARHSLPDRGCCHGAGCHCYINYPPVVSAPPMSWRTAFVTPLPSGSTAPHASAPPDERFRPPIA